jgi:hypothetical protein
MRLEPTMLKQGDLGLVETGVARRLLSSRIPARFAYVAADGTPRVLATWFVWTGEVLAMPTFLAAGEEAARAYLAQIDQPGTRMAGIDLHPTWAGVLDFQSRLPSALGGITEA